MNKNINVYFELEGWEIPILNKIRKKFKLPNHTAALRLSLVLIGEVLDVMEEKSKKKSRSKRK